MSARPLSPPAPRVRRTGPSGNPAATPQRQGPLISERRLHLAGYGTRALETRGRGPVIVLLHGFADSADTWRQVLGRLAREGRAAVALDLPGFATADRLHRGEPVLEQLVEFSRAAIERFDGAGPRRRASDGSGVVLVGNSLGGSTALLTAQGAGRPLRGVMPIAPAGFDMGSWLFRLETLGLLRALMAVPYVPHGPMRRVIGRIYRELAVHEQAAVGDHLVAAFAHHFDDRSAVSRYLETGHRMLPELGEHWPLDDIRVPMQIVWGRQDRMLTYRNAQLLLDAVPGARLETLDPCGHCPQVECAERTAELIMALADEVA
jgi:pimeloyl-ACP methyl ester carboxylesterase